MNPTTYALMETVRITVSLAYTIVRLFLRSLFRTTFQPLPALENKTETGSAEE